METHKMAARCANTETAKTAGKSSKSRTIIIHAIAFACKALALTSASVVLALIGCAVMTGIVSYGAGAAAFSALSWALSYVGEVLECER